MIIQLEKTVSDQQKQHILDAVKSINYKATEVSTQFGKYLVCIGKQDFDIRLIGSLVGVRDVHRVNGR